MQYAQYIQFMAYTISKALAYIITLYTVTSLDKTFKFFQALYILGIPVCTNLQEHCVRSIVKNSFNQSKVGFPTKENFRKKTKFREFFFVYRKLSAKTMPNFAGKINLRQFHENCESVIRKKAKKRKLMLYYRIFSCFFIDFFSRNRLMGKFLEKIRFFCFAGNPYQNLNQII